MSDLVNKARSVKQEALAKVAENIEKIKALVEESREISKEASVPFDLSDIELFNDDQVEEKLEQQRKDYGWDSSNC